MKKMVPTPKNNDTSLPVNNSSRIVNLNKLQEHLQVISQHAATCQLYAVNAVFGKEAIVLVGEQNCEEHCSILTFHCVGCNKEFQFSTSSRVQSMSGGRYWEYILAAVWGKMNTGGGHAPFTE